MGPLICLLVQGPHKFLGAPNRAIRGAVAGCCRAYVSVVVWEQFARLGSSRVTSLTYKGRRVVQPTRLQFEAVVQSNTTNFTHGQGSTIQFAVLNAFQECQKPVIISLTCMYSLAVLSLSLYIYMYLQHSTNNSLHMYTCKHLQ